MSKSNKIVIIGNEQDILHYRLCGAAIMPAICKDTAKNLIDKAIKDDFSVIVVSKEFSDLVDEFNSKLKNRLYPLITTTQDFKEVL